MTFSYFVCDFVSYFCSYKPARLEVYFFSRLDEEENHTDGLQ